MDPAKLREVSETLKSFKNALSRSDIDFDACSSLLSNLKVSLTEFRSLPPFFEATPNAAQELTLAMNIYEHAVILSVKMKDLEAFEREFYHFRQLNPYDTGYGDYTPQSPQEYEIVGLNLLRLLIQNRVVDLHTELDLLSSTALENACIKFSIELLQSILEGEYYCVFSARESVPRDTYLYFMDLLPKAMRNGVAQCIVQSCGVLPVSTAKELLRLSSDEDFHKYIQEEHPEWEIMGESVYVLPKANDPPYKKIPSSPLINQTLGSARELERIV